MPPANRPEKLKGNRTGHYSIRINRPWRICFVWRSGDAYEVEIVGYDLDVERDKLGSRLDDEVLQHAG